MEHYYELECDCETLNDINEKVCNNCGVPLPGTVNMRRALLPIEVRHLEKRYTDAKAYLYNKNLIKESEILEQQVKSNGKGVINTQFAFLWEWLYHNNFSYESYRRQLIKGSRFKAKFENDIKRSVADSLLFGSENDIIYSALSINESGVSSYGDMTVILKTNSINKRTSSLERNSFHFLSDLITQGWNLEKPFPPGHMSDWPDLFKLVIAKLHRRIDQNIGPHELAILILNSTGDRTSDEFVELYIYGKIIASVVEKIRIPQKLIDTFNLKEKIMLRELSRKFNVVIYRS